MKNNLDSLKRFYYQIERNISK